MAASRAVRSHRWESAARWLRSMLPSHIVPSPDDSFCQHKTTDDFIIGGHIEVYPLGSPSGPGACWRTRSDIRCHAYARHGWRGAWANYFGPKAGQTPRSYNAAWRTAVEAWRNVCQLRANMSRTACYPFATQLGSTGSHWPGSIRIATAISPDNSIPGKTGRYRTNPR